MKFYDRWKGFGYVTLDDGYELPPGVPKELRLEESEVNAGGKKPLNMKELPMELGIWKTKKGAYKAYNATLAGGVPITQEALENRQLQGSAIYSGVVEVNMWKQGWGLIKLDPGPLPPDVAAKLAEMQQAAVTKSNQALDQTLYFRSSDIRDGHWLKKGQKVQFHVYTDDKGAGAIDIH